MFEIAKIQLKSGLSDARFIFLFIIIILVFITNASIYSSEYQLVREDWEKEIAATSEVLRSRSFNLQILSIFYQNFTMAPSPAKFIADGNSDRMPNSLKINAFYIGSKNKLNRDNPRFPILPPLDWVFIIGSLVTPLAIMLSFGSICGDKKQGTLKQILSYPISRMELFIGKYLGIVTTLTIALLIGILFNLTTIYLLGQIPITFNLLLVVGNAFFLGFLCLSLAVLGSMAVSSLVHTPSVSLVICMVIWLVTVVAIPGMSRLAGENVVEVPTPSELQKLTSESFEKTWSSMEGGGRSNNSSYAWRVSKAGKERARGVKKIVNENMQIYEEFERKCVAQIEAINNLNMFSAQGILNNALQKFSQTGVYGYKKLRDLAGRYRDQFYQFVFEQDKTDTNSPHSVYAWYNSVDRNSFSMKPVEYSTIPRSHVLFSYEGLSEKLVFPWLETFLLLISNLQMAFVAIFALMKYDPR